MELFFILLLYLLFAVKCLDISFLLFRGPLPFSLSDLRRADTLGTAGGVLSYSLTPSHMQTWSCPLLPGSALTTSLGQGPLDPPPSLTVRPVQHLGHSRSPAHPEARPQWGSLNVLPSAQRPATYSCGTRMMSSCHLSGIQLSHARAIYPDMELILFSIFENKRTGFLTTAYWIVHPFPTGLHGHDVTLWDFPEGLDLFLFHLS